MATGDMENNGAKVRKQLQAIQYPHDVTLSVESLMRGAPDDHLAELLRILHYAFLDHSRHVAQLVQDAGFDLYGKTDVRFVDGVFRFAREKLSYFPHLTTTQFLSPRHYRETKLILLADLLALVAKTHAEAAKREKQRQAVWIPPSNKSQNVISAPHHVHPAEVEDAKITHPRVSINLGQPKHPKHPARVVRHERHSFISDDISLPRQETPTEEPPVIDWTTQIEGTAYPDLDKNILQPSNEQPKMWWSQPPTPPPNNQHEEELEEEDMNPRKSFDVAPEPKPPVLSPMKPVDIRAELAQVLYITPLLIFILTKGGNKSFVET
ncbi:hypothetical protein LEN26_010727 [Aphanomyces euteiches]|nr:hypothetical protein LEN26_010727 [Aphanomyces euteiches]KAH9127439.1 hypothetical protein AeMF1_002252 [Aphanomyces euteiches]